MGVARNCLGCHNGEFAGRWAPELRGQYRAGVAKGLGMLLATENKNFPIGQHDTIAERASIRHIGRPGDGDWPIWPAADIDRVGAIRGLDIYRRTGVLVSCRSPDGEDFTYVIHDCIAVHAVSAGATVTCTSSCDP